MSKKITFFTVEFYLDEKQEIRAEFKYDGEVLRGLDEDLAYECFDRSVRLRAILNALYTDADELLTRFEEDSPAFAMRGEGH